MLRTVSIGATATGLAAAVAGYVWVAFEFPFAIVLPAVVGVFVVAAPLYSRGRSVVAALVGGAAFTAAFLMALFMAVTDGSPFALPAWLGAVAAAGIAGAVTGSLLEGFRRSVPLVISSALGMVFAVALAALIRAIAPGAVDTAGAAQNLYVTAVLGLIGVIMGASLGTGVARMKDGHATLFTPRGMHPVA